MEKDAKIQSHLEKAWGLRGVGKYDESKKALEMASSLCNTDDHSFLGRIQHIKMQYESDHDNYDKAIEFCRKAVSHYEKAKNHDRIAHSRRHLADLQVELGRLDEAELNYHEALDLYRNNDDTHIGDLINALRGYAILLGKQMKTTQAKKVWQEILQHYQDVGYKDAELDAIEKIRQLENKETDKKTTKILDYHKEIIGHIEVHSVEGIKDCFENGVSPNDTFRGEPLINELTSEYLRGPRFKQCVKAFVDYGLEFEDKPLLAVLLDDADSLNSLISQKTGIIDKTYSLRCAYTQMLKVTLLHICAEFNHLACARSLVENGADVNAKAGFDENGFGGQTPIFHTVNQNMNQSEEMMDFLLADKADLSITVKGLVWGRSYEWETFIPAVNPISYAMMGLLPQMHRNEITISEIVSKLMTHEFGIDYDPE
ncbi:MAG: tetratricopeptide repeat protein, partial [Flavobacteriaceae bacterium]